jgi:hypothetical protein
VGEGVGVADGFATVQPVMKSARTSVSARSIGAAR